MPILEYETHPLPLQGVGLGLSMILFRGIPKTVQSLEGWDGLASGMESTLTLAFPSYARLERAFLAWGRGRMAGIHSYPQLREPYKVGKKAQQRQKNCRWGGESLQYMEWCVLEWGKNTVFVWLCEMESWHGGKGVACSGQTSSRAWVPEPCPQATGPFPFLRRLLCWAKVRIGIS